MFLLSPFLLLAVYGFRLMWAAGQRWLVILTGGVTAVMLMYNASYVVWEGGWSIGPRHLIPMLPFLCVPVAWALERMWHRPPSRAAAGSLVVASVVIVWIQTVGGWDFPADSIAHPLTQYSLPHLLRGELSLNVGMALGLDGLASLIPWLALVLAVVAVVPRVLAGGDERAVRPPGTGAADAAPARSGAAPAARRNE